MQESTHTIEAIRIIYKYIIKRAFKLFDNETRLSSLQQLVKNLRLTSKDLNNSICDELSLEIMHRWMKGLDRFARVTKRIEQLLQKGDKNNLIKFLDSVVKILSKRESVRLLSSFLVPITQHHKHILKDYMDFFTSRKLHMTMKEYFLVERSFPFPGFTPQQVEKSLQIANENGWIEESLLLFNLFLKDYFETDKDHKIRMAISNGVKLNFEGNVANRFSNIINARIRRKVYGAEYTFHKLLPRYLRAQQITTSNIMEILHNVSQKEAEQILVKSKFDNKSHSRIISFRGSQLVKYFKRHPPPRFHPPVFFSEIQQSTKIFTGLPPSPEYQQRLYLYHYYRAVAENDFETAKRIHRENNIVLEHFEHHPHPLSEYVRVLYENAVEPVQEMIDYLIENFGGVEKCLHYQWNKDAVARLWPTIKQLIEKGAIIDDIIVWKHYFNDNIPRNEREFRTLMARSDRTSWLCTRIMDFLLYTFSMNSEALISETKLLLLLAWKYDSKCHLSKLPKELLKLIVDFIDEPPLFIQYATIAIKDIERTNLSLSTNKKALERNGKIAKFYCDNVEKIDLTSLWFLLLDYTSQKTIKRDAKYLKEILEKSCNGASMPKKVFRYFCKYETEDEKILVHIIEYICIWKYHYKDLPLLEYAVAVKNIKLLHEYFKCPEITNKTLNEDLYAAVAPNRKNKMSYKEAVELVNEIRSKYIHVDLDQNP